MTLTEIEKLTKEYADARTVLGDRVQRLNDEIEAIKKRLLPGIKKALAMAIESKADLKAAIEEGAYLFEKPRTIVVHGVKVGLQKGKGEITWEDKDQVVKLLKKHFPDTWETYVQVKEKPLPSALKNLTVVELKKVGCAAEETGDQVVIKGTDSDVDKLVKALLKEHENEEMEEAA